MLGWSMTPGFSRVNMTATGPGRTAANALVPEYSQHFRPVACLVHYCIAVSCSRRCRLLSSRLEWNGRGEGSNATDGTPIRIPEAKLAAMSLEKQRLCRNWFLAGLVYAHSATQILPRCPHLRFCHRNGQRSTDTLDVSLCYCN